MPSRRWLLGALGTTTIGGTAGCIGRVSTLLTDDRTVEGPCDEPGGGWPTAGGDPGRTGRTDTAPPAPDADVVDLHIGVREENHRWHASSLPVVGDETAYVPVTGGLVAVDLDDPTADATWSYDLEDDVAAVPALTCGVVLAPGINRLAALDPATGEHYWGTDVGSAGETAVAALDETIYVGGHAPAAVDTRSGDVRWSAEAGDTVAVDDTGVYTTLNVNGTGGIFAHDLDGEERWQLALGKIVGSASVLDGTVWVADNHGSVYAIDGLTGETHWSRSPDGVHKVHSGLAVTGEVVVVPAGNGSRSVVLDADTGETRWGADTGIVTGRPVVGDDWVAFGRTNVGVTVYERATGRERTTWSREEHDLRPIDGLLPVEGGFVVREGMTSSLRLIR